MRRLLLALGAALGACGVLIGVAWAASTGVGPLASGERPIQFLLPSPTSSNSFGSTPTTPPPSEARPGSATGPDLTWIGLTVEVIILLVAVAVLVAILAPLVPRRISWRMPRAPERIEFDDPRATAQLKQELAAAREVHLTRLYEGTPRNGVIECWMSFEQASTAVGLPPRLAETPTEFLARLLARLQVDPGPGVRLAELYHVARFSSHPLSEADREAARKALLEVHAQLRPQPDSEVSGVGS